MFGFISRVGIFPILLLSSVASSFGVEPVKTKVIVTGAAGRTGKLVHAKLEDHPAFQPVGLVRTEKSARSLLKEFKCELDHIVIADVTELDDTTTPPGLQGAKAMVICTSAVPKISKLSIFLALLKAPLNLIRRKKAVDPRAFKFKWSAGGYPEKVDYKGQIAQIDLAKRLGVEQVVIVSSMGGTDPDNFLNTIGKDNDGGGNGDILLWKRRAERYLTESGLFYTIIHPGGLVDKDEGTEKFVLDVDDKLLQNKKRAISRTEVANLCVAALTVGKGQNVSFDCITREAEENEQVVSAEEALKEFLAKGVSADYSL